MRIYVLTLEIREGNDEFWEAIGRRSGRKEVREEVEQCLADHGFCKPQCKVRVDDVITTR
jgi:hypothetical protein